MGNCFKLGAFILVCYNFSEMFTLFKCFLIVGCSDLWLQWNKILMKITHIVVSRVTHYIEWTIHCNSSLLKRGLWLWWSRWLMSSRVMDCCWIFEIHFALLHMQCYEYFGLHLVFWWLVLFLKFESCDYVSFFSFTPLTLMHGGVLKNDSRHFKKPWKWHGMTCTVTW